MLFLLVFHPVLAASFSLSLTSRTGRLEIDRPGYKGNEEGYDEKSLTPRASVGAEEDR
jgi:hypothetical protein